MSTLLILTIAFPLGSSAVIDPDAAVVLARSRPDTSYPDPCAGLDNCFTYTVSTASWLSIDLDGDSFPDAIDLWSSSGWIWATRNPSASAPLLLDVGPGTFKTFFCDGTGTSPLRGHVTLRGSGREQTILKGGNRGIQITNCTNLSFMDLGAQGTVYGATFNGTAGGSTSWTNVDLVALGTAGGLNAGWSDDCFNPPSSPPPSQRNSVHYFHGSRIRSVRTSAWQAADSVGFYSACAENWIFGGEIFLDLSGGNTNSATAIAVPGGFVETFGTAIRGRIRGSYVPGSGELVGVKVSGPVLTSHTFPVAFHSHGTNFGLATDAATQTNINVVAISAQDEVMVHMPGTAYALSPGSSASATRVRITGGTPHVMAPFQWSADTVPPEVTTVKGEDLFVETDCHATGCSSTGTEPHLLVSNPSCTSGWWDVGLKTCR